uniref:Uncharacterized protein n=1 Tax=Moniliophthora roreri TaxID=221103 RepID=A0A0W0FVM8_MONRR
MSKPSLLLAESLLEDDGPSTITSPFHLLQYILSLVFWVFFLIFNTQQYFYDMFIGCQVPDHLIYYNNCNLLKYAWSNDHPVIKEFFKNVGLTVDVFYFNCKHKETDKYCNCNCNPYAFPELVKMDANGKSTWYFNTSIAEQKNAWLGDYLPICREMGAILYDFFLNIMIMLHNKDTIAKLEAEGKNPRYW